MMSWEDLFARQRQTWATCPDWVQTIIFQNIRETTKAKMEKEHGIHEDRREGFTDGWEAVAAEVQSQMSRWPPHGQLLGFRHAQLHAFRHIQLHRMRVKLPATCILEPWREPRITATSVRYGAGRGGFSLTRPRPYTGPGGYVSGNPRPAPVGGPPALIPWTGPRLLPPIFNGDPSGVWEGRGPERGQGQGMPKKTPRPRPLSGAGQGKGPGARVFQGPVRPVTNSNRNDSQETVTSFDFTQVSATRLLHFRDSDLQTPNGSKEVAGGLTLHNTVTPTTLRQLALTLDDLGPVEETTHPLDIEHGESASIDAGS